MQDCHSERLCTIEYEPWERLGQVYSCQALAWVEKSQSALIFKVWVDVQEICPALIIAEHYEKYTASNMLKNTNTHTDTYVFILLVKIKFFPDLQEKLSHLTQSESHMIWRDRVGTQTQSKD